MERSGGGDIKWWGEAVMYGSDGGRGWVAGVGGRDGGQ